MPEKEERSEQRQALPPVLPPKEASIVAADAVDDGRAAKEAVALNDGFSRHKLDAAALQNEIARAHIESLHADRRMRETYAGRILRYLEYYSGGVAILLLLDGSGPGGFHLEESVVTALVGSTAVAAIGLVGFIARGLFRPLAPPRSPDTD